MYCTLFACFCPQWELIAGPDLLELLNEAQGRMNERAAAFYFVQLLRAVLHMHAMGYCHRDIKPENCMVERSTQRLKVCVVAQAALGAEREQRWHDSWVQTPGHTRPVRQCALEGRPLALLLTH